MKNEEVKSVIHWDLCARFRNKKQAVSFLTALLEQTPSPTDVTFSEFEDRYEVSVIDMAWAANLVSAALSLEDLDNEVSKEQS